MISVGRRRDARKEIELGSGGGFGGGEMEAELEEGEACSYQNEEEEEEEEGEEGEEEDYNASIDPDAHSYIDDKIQDVLGHFQKDFEGGVVSAENLGSKFGGYGSFLPSYQRSPAWSHPRTPPIVQNHSITRSPNNLQNGQVRLGPSSTSSSSRAMANEPTTIESVKANLVKPSIGANNRAHKRGSVSTKSDNLTNQKTLKVRVKVGSSNFSTQNNPEIYCDLGLQDSPSDSEGISRDLQRAAYESPTSILKIMTRFPVQNSPLLSPLPYNLIELSEKEKPHNNDHRSDFAKSGKMFVDNKVKQQPMEKNNKNDILVTLKKKSEMDTFACEDIVSNTLRLPLLSKLDPLETSVTQGDGSVKQKPCIDGKVWDRKANHSPKKDAYLNGERTYESIKENSKGKNAMNGELIDLHKKKASQKATLNEHDSTTSTSGKEHVFPEVKHKSKGSSRIFSSSIPKLKNGTEVENIKSKGEFEDLRSQQDLEREKDRYKDFFGELEEEEENQVGSLEVPSEDLLKQQSDLFEKSSSAINRASKDRSSVRKMDTPNVAHHSIATPSDDVDLEKGQVKFREQQEELDLHSIGGDAKSLKMKSRKDRDQDFSRASKKMKTENADFIEDSRVSNHKGAIENIAPSISSDFPATSGGKKWLKNSGRSSSKHSKSDSKERRRVSVEKARNEVPAALENGPLEIGDGVTKNNAKKRKTKDVQEIQTYHESINNTQNLQESRGLVKEFSENEYREEKKARVSKSERKESRSSKGSGKSEKRGSQSKSYKPGKPIQPSVAATSSSSKISTSHKTKSSFQDVKGSPVESVSSSPLRISNPDKLIPTAKGSKDDRQGTNIFATNSPRKCSDDEEDGAIEKLPSTRRKDNSERDLSHSSGRKARSEARPPSNNKAHHLKNLDLDNQGLVDSQYPSSKSGKSSSSQMKDKNRKSVSDPLDMEKFKTSDPFDDELQERSPPYKKNSENDKSKFPEKSHVKFDDIENKHVSKKDSLGKISGQSSKRESWNQLLDSNGEMSSDKTNKVEVASDRRKSLPLASSNGGENEIPSLLPRPSSQKGNVCDTKEIDVSEDNEALKGKKQIRKSDHQNGTQNLGSKYPETNGCRTSDAPSPAKRDFCSQAANNALKEAKDLKHMADRLKNSGSNMESIGLYFEAALKFLHGASLLESCNNGAPKHIYSSTAKLFGFCAHEFEKSKDMLSAALAYKCMEVAYMRVIYSSHNNASRDQNELQAALKMVPPGESPSSSASDVDNLNNLTTGDKGVLPKGISSPKIAGNYVIAAKNRPNFVRLLNFAQDVESAMEASRKSQVAYAAVNVSSEEAKAGEGVSCIKRALDFNFQDVEGLLRLVRLAMDSFNR